jgi:hypothetical protein
MSVPQAEWKVRSSTNQVYTTALQTAQNLGLPFTIKRDHIPLPAKCPVFGDTLELSRPKRHPRTPVAIMVDPSLGFVPGNVRIVSYRAAEIRGEVTPADLRAVAEFLIKEGAPDHAA